MKQVSTHDLSSSESNSPGAVGKTTTIPVISENVTVQKEQVVTGKVSIKKTVHEEVQTVNVPVFSDEYEITRVLVEPKTLDSPPAPVRHVGDTMIIPVVREITVIQKRYEVTEEIHIRHNKSEQTSTHEIILKSERVEINREG